VAVCWELFDVILVVDDDSVIRETVVQLLNLEGYAAIAARDGSEALRLVEEQHPNLVLLDMRMPVLDGWGFARALHERHLTRPIIVMTAAQDARRWAREIGAAGWLAKPFDFDELLAQIRRLAGPPGPAPVANGADD
jgi:DNA-binding response OmpR family regulator